MLPSGEPLLDSRQAVGRRPRRLRGRRSGGGCRRSPVRGRGRATCAPSSARARALGEQAGAVGGFRDPAADLADAGRRAGQAAADPADVGERAVLRRRRAASCPGSRSGVTARTPRAGPTTACTPGSSAIRRCQRVSAASRSGSVIGPLSVAATTTNGRFEAGPDRAGEQFAVGAGRVALRRAGSGSAGPSSAPGPGPASTSTTAPIAIATGSGRRSARGDEAHHARASPRAPAPSCQRSRFGPSRVRTAGPAIVATSDAEHDDERRRSPPARRAASRARRRRRPASRAAGCCRRTRSCGPAVRRVTAARVDRLGAVRQLFAEARDHQQGVVDPERQPHHRADRQREGVDVEPVGEDVEQAARAGDGHRAEDERDRRGDRRAEDEQEDDQEDRQGDQLAALGGGDRLVLDRPREGRVAGLGRPDRRVDLLGEDRVRARRPSR